MPSHLLPLALKGDPIPWLLEEADPPVRYRALTELLGRPFADAEVQAARDAVAAYPPFRPLFDTLAQNPWDVDNCARLGLPGELPAVHALCERWLDTPLWGAGPSGKVWTIPHAPCYVEQSVGGLIHYGYLDDPRLQPRLAYILREQRFYDGNRPGSSLRYDRGHCAGAHSCFTGVVRSLWALSRIPPERRTPEIADFLQSGAEYLTAHRLYQSNHRRFRPIKAEWTRLHLPFALGWHTDVLDLLETATALGLGDAPCVAPAIELILGKQNERGRWCVEAAYSGHYKHLCGTAVQHIEPVGAESKWITLTVLLALKCCGSIVRRIQAGEPIEQLPPEPQPAFHCYDFPAGDSEERRLREEWRKFGMEGMLAALLGFGDEAGLLPGWHEHLALGPAGCREWCRAEARKVPARSMKNAWPVCRLTFLAPAGCYTAEELSQRLGIPLRDQYPGNRRPGNWLDATLWRLGVERWRDGIDEVGITVRTVEELQGAIVVMRESLSALRRAGVLAS